MSSWPSDYSLDYKCGEIINRAVELYESNSTNFIELQRFLLFYKKQIYDYQRLLEASIRGASYLEEKIEEATYLYNKEHETKLNAQEIFKLLLTAKEKQNE